jgi:hypothetical protein
MSSNSSKPTSTPASAGRKTRLPTTQKSDCNAPLASLSRYAAPTRDVDPSVPQGQKDAPPSKEGRYAAPATPGHDDESATKSPNSESASTIRQASIQRPFLGPQQIESLMKSQYGNKTGTPPASFATVLEQDREETPTPSEMPPSTRSPNSGGFEVFPTKRHTREGAISGNLASFANTPNASDAETPSWVGVNSDTSLSPQSRMSRIRVIAEDVRQRSGEDDDLLGALQLTFDKERLKSIFPRRIEERPLEEESNHRRYAFNQDYVSHLTSVMTLSCDTLNEFLRAAGSDCTFTYGSSKYYEGQTFEEVLYRDWPAQTIALSLEKRLLERIATAHRAISTFMANADYIPGRGMPRPASPAFTDNSTFARQVASSLSNKAPAIASPRQEDAAWSSEVEIEAQTSYYQAASEAFREQPEASTSYNHLDKGKTRVRSRPPSESDANPARGNDPDDEDESCTPQHPRPSQQPSRHGVTGARTSVCKSRIHYFRSP